MILYLEKVRVYGYINSGMYSPIFQTCLRIIWQFTHSYFNKIILGNSWKCTFRAHNFQNVLGRGADQ
jgi:hypothetical protein